MQRASTPKAGKLTDQRPAIGRAVLGQIAGGMAQI